MFLGSGRGPDRRVCARNSLCGDHIRKIWMGLKKILIENPDPVTVTPIHCGVREVGLWSQLCVCAWGF